MNTVIETLSNRLSDLNNELNLWENPTEIMLNGPSLADHESDSINKYNVTNERRIRKLRRSTKKSN